MHAADPSDFPQTFPYALFIGGVSFGEGTKSEELMTAIYFPTLSDPCISISILIPRVAAEEK